MNLRALFIVCSLLFLFSSLSYSQTKSSSKTSVGLQLGLNRGFGGTGFFTIHDFAEGLPGNVRLGIGLTKLEPGDAGDSRRIFINNATNGVPEEKGKSMDIRLDYMLPYKFFNFKDSYLVFGPRYSSFTANFNYIGGNENFDITSKQWGLGLGGESYFKMANQLDLVLATGLDYFFNSTLKGHDTSYSPGDDNVNERDNENGDPYTYKDANKAVKQPQFMPRVMVGVTYRF